MGEKVVGWLVKRGEPGVYSLWVRILEGTADLTEDILIFSVSITNLGCLLLPC